MATMRNASPSHRCKLPILRFAKAGRVRKDRLEYRHQLAGRGADHAQYVRGRGLLLQGFAQIVSALPQLVEQAGVLDGDDGLGGEVRDQLDVLVGEGAYFLAIDGDGADQLALLQHRYRQQRAGAAEVGQLDERLEPSRYPGSAVISGT